MSYLHSTRIKERKILWIPKIGWTVIAKLLVAVAHQNFRGIKQGFHVLMFFVPNYNGQDLSKEPQLRLK